MDSFVRSLIATQLVAKKGPELTLTTIECTTLVTPEGKYVAGENNAGQMENWLVQKMGKPHDQLNTLVVRVDGD